MQQFINIVPHFIDAIAPRAEMQWDRYGDIDSGYTWCLIDSAHFGDIKWCLSIQASGNSFEAHIWPHSSGKIFPIGTDLHLNYIGGSLGVMQGEEFLQDNRSREEAIATLYLMWSESIKGIRPQPTPIE